MTPSTSLLLSDLNTHFVSRLRARDAKAWFELWETFGPVLRAQLSRWGRGKVGIETVQDLSQETLAALANSIDTHDPTRGARFSTWLLAIAKHTLYGEIDRRMAAKRGAGVRPGSLDEIGDGPQTADRPDDDYERSVFEAKVAAALRAVEREAGLMEFSVYRMRVLDGQSGKQVAAALGISEPTVSRRLSAVRERLRERLGETFARYSFTEEELFELGRNGLELNPTKTTDGGFDEALAEIVHRSHARRAALEGPPGSTS